MKNIKKKSLNSRNFSSQKSHGHNSQEIWLHGKHSVFSALLKARRKVFEILVTKNSHLELEKFLSKNNLLNHLKPIIKLVEVERIEKIIGTNQIHQGLIASCSRLPIKNQNDLLEELYALEKNQLPTLLLLDQLSDPHNIGAIIRSAASFGVRKIIFCEHNAPKENATIVKTSAGTIELVDLVVVVNFNNLIEKLKKIGYWCVGLAGEARVTINEIKGYDNIALIVGSEGEGVRDLVKKNCDILARIDIDKNVESLNASNAAAIALYELCLKNH